jgi:hypothetical protein
VQSALAQDKRSIERNDRERRREKERETAGDWSDQS